MRQPVGTAQRILDTAQQMVQSRGYNAFSYADISAAVGIRKASIHYYFPNKSDLGQRLVKRYRETSHCQREQIDREEHAPRSKIERYFHLYLDQVRNDQLCLCGILAADLTTLPLAVQQEVKGFFADNEAWLAEVLLEGCQAGTIRCSGLAEAQLLLAGLQGALLVARVYGPDQFQAIAQQLLAKLEP